MAWKPLYLSTAAGAHLPALLISAVFTSASFAVHLTDLTHIWTESLDRAAIVQRSREEATSIDPSSGNQLKIFLDKIKLGLGGGKGTTLALTVNADSDRPSLVLSVSVTLPGGLAPLEWPVRLVAAPQALLTDQLTIPLLQTSHAHMQEMASLTEVLKDKDHVIMKLLDKLEEQGSELGQIFPQAAGKVGRKLDRKKAEEKVRGMAKFDTDSWRKSLGHEHTKETAQLIGEVFGEQAEVVAVGSATSFMEDQESWWENIKGITVNLNSGKISTNGPSKTNKSKPQPTLKKAETQEDEDDAFQVQSTPPDLASTSKPTPAKPIPSKPTSSKSIKIDDSTDIDSDDLDAPSQISKPHPPAPPTIKLKSIKKLGALGGGKKKAAPQPSPSLPAPKNGDDESTADESVSHKSSPSTKKQKTASLSPSPIPEAVPHRPQKPPLGKIGGKKAAPPPPEPEPEPEPELDSETEDEKEPSVSPQPPPIAPSYKPKKGKLGQIGGKKKGLEPDPTPPPASTPPDPSTSTSTPAKTTPKRRLGAIGGNKKGKDSLSEHAKAEDDSQSQRGRGSVQPEEEKTPEPRETSLERADRKREALKRELEAKAAAPVKKKRKF